MKKLVLTLGFLAILGIAMPQEHHWTPITGTQYNMIVNGIIFIDGVEQMSSALEVGAFCGEECRASVFAAFFPPTEQFVASMTVVSDQVSGETITFRLYNHDTDETLEGTSTVEFENLTSVGEPGNWFPLEFLSPQTGFLISATANPEQGGTVNGAGTYNYGEEVTLTVTPNPNYVFNNWTENGIVVCEEASYTFTVTGDRVLFANLTSHEGIGEQDGITVSMYPNPVSKKLEVEVNEPDAMLEIFNLDGVLIYKVKNCPNKTVIETSSWASGTYILRMTTKSSTGTRRFVKE